ncbi:hypothetical protein EZS27_026658 [termite gut metagenome]|uniref:Uncharacterized protein n=1 Tax=termite gut metagenome TaxID=433724 RepID=A0A5J4QS24_9ZZZZ
MEKDKQASHVGNGAAIQEVLINLLKLRVCEKEFQEQANMICERNPSVSYEDTESKFYCGIGDCMAAVGYFIGENAIRDAYDKIPEPDPNTITFETKVTTDIR